VVVKIAHRNKEICSAFRNTGRILIIVAIKLIEDKIDEIPAI